VLKLKAQGPALDGPAPEGRKARCASSWGSRSGRPAHEGRKARCNKHEALVEALEGPAHKAQGQGLEERRPALADAGRSLTAGAKKLDVRWQA